MRPGKRHIGTAVTAAEVELRARAITRDVWRQAERDYLARAPHCLRRGQPERAAAWERAAARARTRWQETMDG